MSRKLLVVLLALATSAFAGSVWLSQLERTYADFSQLDELAGEIRAASTEQKGNAEAAQAAWCLVDNAGQVIARGEEAERVFFAMLSGISSDMTSAVAVLRANRDFQQLWSYLGAQRRELRLRFDSTMANSATGKPLFGGYSHESPTITLNTGHPAVVGNPLELIDTLVHECIHAAQHARSTGEKLVRLANVTERKEFPLPREILDAQSDPLWQQAIRDFGLSAHEVRGLRGRDLASTEAHLHALKRQLEENYGPASSDPLNNYEDINRPAQVFLVDILQDIRSATGMAKTLTFDRVQRFRLARHDPYKIPLQGKTPFSGSRRIRS